MKQSISKIIAREWLTFLASMAGALLLAFILWGLLLVRTERSYDKSALECGLKGYKEAEQDWGPDLVAKLTSLEPEPKSDFETKKRQLQFDRRQYKHLRSGAAIVADWWEEVLELGLIIYLVVLLSRSVRWAFLILRSQSTPEG